MAGREAYAGDGSHRLRNLQRWSNATDPYEHISAEVNDRLCRKITHTKTGRATLSGELWNGWPDWDTVPHAFALEFRHPHHLYELNWREL